VGSISNWNAMLSGGSTTFIGKVHLWQIVAHHWQPMWGVGFIPHNAFSWIEKDDHLDKTIQMSKVGYAKLFRLEWDAHNWNFKSTKGKKEKEMQTICKVPW
jgi:hypothetical protein